MIITAFESKPYKDALAKYNKYVIRTPRQPCPYKYKWQLVDWAVLHKGLRRSALIKMTKRQLYALWYKS